MELIIFFSLVGILIGLLIASLIWDIKVVTGMNYEEEPENDKSTNE